MYAYTHTVHTHKHTHTHATIHTRTLTTLSDVAINSMQSPCKYAWGKFGFKKIACPGSSRTKFSIYTDKRPTSPGNSVCADSTTRSASVCASGGTLLRSLCTRASVCVAMAAWSAFIRALKALRRASCCSSCPADTAEHTACAASAPTTACSSGTSRRFWAMLSSGLKPHRPSNRLTAHASSGL